MDRLFRYLLILTGLELSTYWLVGQVTYRRLKAVKVNTK